MFRRLGSILIGFCENLHRLSRERWNVDCRGEPFFAYPSLARGRLTITSGKRQTQPSRALGFVRDLLESFASPHGHRVVLRADKADGRAL